MLGFVTIAAIIVVAFAAILAIILGIVGMSDSPPAAGIAILLGTSTLAGVAIYIAAQVTLQQSLGNFL